MVDGTSPTKRRRRSRPPPAPTTPDPIEIAMEAEASGNAPEGVAHRLLEKQEQLVRWQIASERAGFGLKVLTACAGLAVAVVLGWMAWDASRAEGLVVEPFLVPEAVAATGAGGEAVARDLLDRLARIGGEAESLDGVQVSDAWSRDVKIEVAQTGLSVGEVQRLLRRTLGHETYVSGEVVELSDGRVRLKARAGPGQAVVAEGLRDQLSDLAAQAAEKLYAEARPTLYAEVLIRRGAFDAAKPLLAAVSARSADARERAYAAYLQGVIGNQEQQAPSVRAGWFRAAARSPDPLRSAMGLYRLATLEGGQGQAAAALRDYKAAAKRVARASGPAAEPWKRLFHATVLSQTQDFIGAEAAWRPLIGGQMRSAYYDRTGSYVNILALLHQISDGRRLMTRTHNTLEREAENWPAVLAGTEDAREPGPLANRVRALAALGRLDEGRAVADALPADCMICWVAKGQLLAAAAAGDVAGADRAFAEAVRLHPAGPASGLWALQQLKQGRLDGTIALARDAHRQSPRWADPLEIWGEALLMKGDAAAAAKKFAQAAPLAPKWGRLHLRWGEALAKLGKAEEAKAKWQAAAGMDLTPADRARVQALLASTA